MTNSSKWKAENPERAKAHAARWREKNPDKVQANWAIFRAQHTSNKEAFRAYRAKWAADWRAANPELAKKQAAHHRKRLTERNLAVSRKLKERPCMDCGQSYPHYVMDFDHVRGTKAANVARMVACSIEKLLKEIDKCDVVCSNCHRKRTFQRNHT